MKHTRFSTIIRRAALATALTAAFHPALRADVITASGSTFNVAYIPTSVVPGVPNYVLQAARLGSFSGDTSVGTGTLGVWFTGSQWAIYTQNQSWIPSGARFFVLAAPADSNRFVQTTTTSNTTGAITYLDHPSCNGRVSARLQVVAEYSPNGMFSGYHNHELGLYYDSSRARWAVFNQDYDASAANSSRMPVGLRLHVTVDSPTIYSNSSAWSPTHFVHTTSASNTIGSVTYLPVAGEGSYYTIPLNVHHFVTERFSYDISTYFCWYGPCGPAVGTVPQLNAPVAIFFDASRGRWAIYRIDGLPIPLNISFTVSRYTFVVG